MFEWWKDLVRPTRISDPRFGDLRFLRDARFWEGRTRFAPTGREIEVLITADAAGPADLHRRFFDNLEARYSTLLPHVTEALSREAERIALKASDFLLVAVDVPPDGDGNSTDGWALSYETQPPSWHFTVRMRGWSPAEIIAER